MTHKSHPAILTSKKQIPGAGPFQTGPHGILQPFADMLKLIFKEDVIPSSFMFLGNKIFDTMLGMKYKVSSYLVSSSNNSSTFPLTPSCGAFFLHT
ncbi:MAG TPA: hypothetical protein DDX84_10180 [Nitrospiraceae bacterium]|nr:hypothetical protein [Nitrospiraceae bacterium]